MPRSPIPRPPSSPSAARPRAAAGRAPWSRPLADLVGRAIDPVLARAGFSQADLLVNWEDIVGEQLAANSRPIRLQWPPRPKDGASPGPATLLIRVETAFAVELQHQADAVLARVNAHLGWRCVGRLGLRQGPIERAEPAPDRRRAPAPAALLAAERQVGAVADDALRAALVRLGGHVLTRRPPES